MRGRPQRYIFQFRLLDVLIVLGVLAVMGIAFIRWPDKWLAGIAIPLAFLVAFVVWRVR